MLFAVDVGNTSISAGVFANDLLVSKICIETKKKHDIEYYFKKLNNFLIESNLKKDEITGFIISSVVPDMTKLFIRLSKEYFNIVPLVVDYKTKTGLKITYAAPSQVGSDRIVNAVAAYNLYGAPAIVVDCGTAITFDLVSKEREYLGGVICPGIGMSLNALYRDTALLPKVAAISKPTSIIGKNTTQSIQIGIVYGFSSMIDGIVERLKREFSTVPKVIGTGGWSSLISQYSKSIQKTDPDLTLQGLRLIFDMKK
ncbi:MAG: type III pantothenate kinase [bacterium]|nr:type III pantothenate kinase [bacterium]